MSLQFFAWHHLRCIAAVKHSDETVDDGTPTEEGRATFRSRKVLFADLPTIVDICCKFDEGDRGGDL